MNTVSLPEPERWTDRLSGGAAAEDVLGAALRRARAATAPSEALLSHVGRGFSFVTPAGGVPALRWRLAMGVFLGVLALGGTVGAARGPLRGWAERHGLLVPATLSSTTKAMRGPAVSAGVRRGALPVAAPVAPLEAMPVVVARAQPVVPSARGARVAGVVAHEEDVGEPAAGEARALRAVFQQLRSEAGGGDAALAALDDYDRRFPSGLLRPEARLARVEALLGLGRRGEALALLDAWEGGGVGLTRNARAARGELRAEARRCAEAAEDFSAVLARSAEDELGGRALYGRASCALRAGDTATAVEALTRYLEGNPDGPHAADARDALARLPAPSAP